MHPVKWASTMKIAYIHYHLKTGGVTTVLKHQVEAVRDVSEILVLAGEPPESPFPTETIHIPGLAYDSVAGKVHDPTEVAESIIEAIRSRWEDGCDILHVHNPTLAKNKNLLNILKILQRKNIRLFLQIHDFAEDGRPLFYYLEEYVPDCHYGVINSRDYEILLNTGLNEKGLHLISNIIIPFDFKPEDPVTDEYILYPIRAIRRKNIGEAILLSQFFQQGETLAVTLPPNSPADIKSYNDWKTFVETENLPILFEAGLRYDFKELVRSSKFLITTSITEGFGFSFLEPWTAKKILWGRKLPPICRDFEKNGIQLNHLYTSLEVPTDWIGKRAFYTEWKSWFLKSCQNFNYFPEADKIDNAYKMITRDDTIDFGLLHEPFQKKIISRILDSKADKARLISLNPYLSQPGKTPGENLIQKNRKAVLDCYSKSIYRRRLLEIYTRVMKDTVQLRIDKKRLISAFLDPENFSLLKWSDYGI